MHRNEKQMLWALVLGAGAFVGAVHAPLRTAGLVVAGVAAIALATVALSRR